MTLINYIYVVQLMFSSFQYPIIQRSDQEVPCSSRMVVLPENVVLDVPTKDLLLRLLEVDPTRRLRNLRTLETIAFYKNYNFKHVKEKKASNSVTNIKHGFNYIIFIIRFSSCN